MVATKTQQAATEFCKILSEKAIDPRKIVLLCERSKGARGMLEQVGVEKQVGRMLERRQELLKSVKSLAFTIGINNFQAFACDSAAYLMSSEVVPLWEKFVS